MCLICESGAHGVDQLQHNTAVDVGRASVRHVELIRHLVHHKLLVLGRIHRFETTVDAELPLFFGKSACKSEQCRIIPLTRREVDQHLSRT